MFSAPNRPGAIHSLLEPMARHGVDMTKLQSRPARSGLWEYVFYADINGHREDPEVAAALRELDERAIAQTLATGIPNGGSMPRYPHLSEIQRRSLALYVLSLARPNSTSTTLP